MADPPRRVNFFYGLMLTAADMAAEQEYHRTARYLHNRLDGYGAVCGLEVAVTNGHVEVSPGIGIDVHGREIVLTEALTMHLEPHRDAGLWIQNSSSCGTRPPSAQCPGRMGPSTSLAGSNSPSWRSLLRVRQRPRS